MPIIASPLDSADSTTASGIGWRDREGSRQPAATESCAGYVHSAICDERREQRLEAREHRPLGLDDDLELGDHAAALLGLDALAGDGVERRFAGEDERPQPPARPPSKPAKPAEERRVDDEVAGIDDHLAQRVVRIVAACRA